MKTILLICIFALVLSGCDQAILEKGQMDLVDSFKVYEGQPISAEVMKVGETLPQTNLTRIIVRLDRHKFMNVLTNEDVVVGQRVRLVNVSYQSTESNMVQGYYFVIVSEEE